MTQQIQQTFRQQMLLVATFLIFIPAHVLATGLPTTQLLPVVQGDEETRSTPFIAWFEDLSVQGYTEEEYVASGSANVYSYAGSEMQPDIEVQKANLPYATRLLVRRPANPETFNGTVFVEVLNATAGWDGDPIWQSTHEYIIRQGATWVGVSTKPVSVDFLRDAWGRPPWPKRNASRYADLSMPEFGQVWDMMSQVGALLKTPASKDNPLGAFDVQRLIMVGYSQSAAYQVTYANSIHDSARMPDGKPIYDGYYIAAGGGSSKHITGPTDTSPESLPPGDSRNLTRASVPVIRYQNQTEVIRSYVVRQWEADFPLLRFYELVGGSHVDSHLNTVGGKALGRDLGLPPSFCPSPENPYNPIRIGYVQSALMEALDRWIAIGASPPASRFLQLSWENREISLAKDADGNVLGGIRPPDIQVPLGTYSGSNSGPGFCGLYGGFTAFDEEKLNTLYETHDAYVQRFKQTVEDSMQEGFLLLQDAQSQNELAIKSSIGKN